VRKNIGNSKNGGFRGRRIESNEGTVKALFRCDDFREFGGIENGIDGVKEKAGV
jgi:hypothetical protein